MSGIKKRTYSGDYLNHLAFPLGTLYRQDGSSTLAGKLLHDGRLCLEFTLPALEVAVWVIECPRAVNTRHHRCL